MFRTLPHRLLGDLVRLAWPRGDLLLFAGLQLAGLLSRDVCSLVVGLVIAFGVLSLAPSVTPQMLTHRMPLFSGRRARAGTNRRTNAKGLHDGF
jgi:hypothetical protein